jgi:hypothetical protein
LVVQEYTPTSGIEKITQRAGMSERGVFLFYASRPSIDDASAFNVHCERREATAAVLGCYANRMIYIYHVQNKELDGIQEVTAAHEMLHAAWDRLSQSERDKLRSLLEAAYNQLKTPELEDRMAYYDRNQPGERLNELHSILGTEAADVGDALESYYAKYFTQRSKVVMLHQGYQKVFAGLQGRTDMLRSQLETESVRLNTDITTYNKAVEALDVETGRHNTRLSQVDRTSAAEVASYNATSQALELRRVRLHKERMDLEARRLAYDTMLKEYNDSIVKSTQLENSIDSLKAPAVVH